MDREAVGASHAREGACGGRLSQDALVGSPLAGAGTGGGDLRRVGWEVAGEG